jgi:serine/threonine protein phosphatase 1
MTIYAIGDIHGHLDKLRAAHDLVEADRAREGTRDAPLIHVGDLVDRGPDSAGVVRYLRESDAGRPGTIVLKGNHDSMFLEFLTQPPRPLVRDPLPAPQYRRARDAGLLRAARRRLGPRAA